MIQIHISNKITIKGLPERYREHLKAALTLDNPKYFELMGRMKKYGGKWVGAFYGCPDSFTYFKEDGDDLVVPRGMKSRVLRFLDKVGLEYKVEEDFVFKKLEV